jgi:hypothetical protein
MRWLNVTWSHEAYKCQIPMPKGQIYLNNYLYLNRDYNTWSHRRKLGGASAPPIFFLPKNSCFGHWVKDGQIKKHKYFQNNYLGGVETEETLKKPILLLFITWLLRKLTYLTPMFDFAPNPLPPHTVMSHVTPMLGAITKLFWSYSCKNFEYQMNYVYVKRLLVFRLTSTRLMI